MTSRFVGLPCCLTIICDNAFLPTPAKYECQAPTIWVPRDQSVSGTDLKIDNLDRVSIPTKIVAIFDVEHPILGTTYGI